LDDELIIIKNIVEIDLFSNNENKINSVFLDKDIEYKAFTKDITKAIELPISNITATKFVGFDKKEKRISREAKEEFRQVEFINCEIEFQEDILSFLDNQLENRLVFY